MKLAEPWLLDAGLGLTQRRDRIVQTAADNMSAGSRTTPAGHALPAGERRRDIARFAFSDCRPASEVYAAIRANGQEVVFKNEDNRR
ncbi:MAG: hypothetical protein ACI4Q3_10150 [Kiritimatiellia bacterium]